MTLRKMGRTTKEEIVIEQTTNDSRQQLINQIQRLNDYMALMTNEPEPPTETDEKL